MSKDPVQVKVFDLKNYELLYDISDAAVSELKVSPGILLLIHDYEGKDHVPLKILSVEDGNVLKEFKHDLLPGRTVDFVEQFDEKGGRRITRDGRRELDTVAVPQGSLREHLLLITGLSGLGAQALSVYYVPESATCHCNSQEDDSGGSVDERSQLMVYSVLEVFL